ncbi:MAG: Anaerobic sulfite reductase subunit C [Elusimicrobia bacterium ADurb.Bin231]|nr:MAG: Anaerobic sulfite reductase subunit C [Elusimicrobia bacterium ADurb.Bin231]
MQMKKVKIDSDRCKGCQLCINVCPKGCLKLSNTVNAAGFQYAIYENESKCTSCGFCFLVCPDVAIEVSRKAKPRVEE